MLLASAAVSRISFGAIRAVWAPEDAGGRPRSQCSGTLTGLKAARLLPGEDKAEYDRYGNHRIPSSGASDGGRQGGDPALCRQASGPGMADDCGHGALLLPGPSRHPRGALPRVPGAAGLCRRAAGAVPVWAGEARLRQVSGALLSARPARAGQGGDAVCRPAHALAASAAVPAPLAG